MDVTDLSNNVAAEVPVSSVTIAPAQNLQCNHASCIAIENPHNNAEKMKIWKFILMDPFTVQFPSLKFSHGV
ncbi:hypothetical protein E3N88_21034 [Mikania micrantha]|uniref:Uncharacterized protein n=1 Tax=Mikania micrantha TaxID=192012 RepID=A0A5N6NIQ7_9ASTR|nr:hypothetical protein E3N88_21034 [Mikania micrantha]